MDGYDDGYDPDEYPYADERGAFKWRTVGGKRIRIYKGQSLSEAMIASGKFPSAKSDEYAKNMLTGGADGDKMKKTATTTQPPPDIEEAAKGTNPSFTGDIDDLHSWNCQKTVVAYELRRQGNDVEAMPAAAKAHEEIRLDLFERNGTPIRPLANVTKTDIKKEIGKMPDGTRFVVRNEWADPEVGARFFIAEKANGKVWFIDPQSGNTDVAEYFKKSKSKYAVWQIDGMTFKGSATELGDIARRKKP
jgi:hypothetical protein